MKKNWYAVYTKLNCELKVIAQFNRKKINNYCPLNSTSSNSGFRKRWNNMPLFKSIVFVYISDQEMVNVKQTTDVLNFLYWLGSPAVINNEEIKNIERFTSDYTHIITEKMTVNPYATLQIISNIDLINTNVSYKSTSIKMLLPSLGFSIMACVESSTFKLFDSIAKGQYVSQ